MEARRTTATAIEYAPPPPRHRRWLRRWLLPAILLATLVSAYWWGPPFAYRLKLAYYERQCGSYVPPPDTIVYTASHNDAKRLAATSAGYQPGPANEQSVFLVPPAWSKFYGLLSPPGFRSMGTAFLHERRTPRGRTLLVAVDYLGDTFQESDLLPLNVSEFQVRAFEPGGPFSLPVEVQTDRFPILLPTSSGLQGPLRLRAGQPDPNDATHFTIAWELVDDPRTGGVIDGWVRDRGVVLEPRELTPPPPSSPARSPSSAGSASTQAAASDRAGG